MIDPIHEQDREECAPRSSSILRILLLVLLVCYFLIVLWGVLFKCNNHFTLNRAYEILHGEPFPERLFHDDLRHLVVQMRLGNFHIPSFISVLLNCILLTPFGFGVAHFIKKKRVWRVTLLCFLLCFAIEIVQLFTYWGAFAVADLVTNTFSGFLGACLYGRIYRPEREGIFTRIAAVFVLLAIPFTVWIVVRTGMDMSFYLELASRPF